MMLMKNQQTLAQKNKDKQKKLGKIKNIQNQCLYNKHYFSLNDVHYKNQEKNK